VPAGIGVRVTVPDADSGDLGVSVTR